MGGGNRSDRDHVAEKRRALNRTQRNTASASASASTTRPLHSDKVNSVLMSIHSQPFLDEEDVQLDHFETANYAGADPSTFANTYAAVHSPDVAAAAAATSTRQHTSHHRPANPFSSTGRIQEGMATVSATTPTSTATSPHQPLPVDNDQLQMQELRSNFMTENQMEDYYKKTLAGAAGAHSNRPRYSSTALSASPSSSLSPNEDAVTHKLNYIISLLEEQQDYRTHHVMEEVVLYSFLGIFVIFVVDSFVRVGKYVR